MNNERESTEAAGQAPATGPVPRSLSADAANRRRVLLKGVGRGGALLAATVPLKTLAGQRILTSDYGHQCIVSGMHSGVHSASPGTSQVCTGFTPSYFGQSTNGGVSPCNAWPTLPNRAWSYNTPCVTVFTQCRLSGTPTLFQVLNRPTYASSDERHWVCAWLNALRGGTLNFPYTPQQVLNYYNASDANALSFFKGFMETLAA